MDNGRYYVSKTITDEKSRPRKCFLEYVVCGQLNLYRLGRSTKDDIYFLEDENGKMAQFEEVKLGTPQQDRRTILKDALLMTNKSQSTQKMLWEKEVNRKSAIKAVVNYNNEVCPDGRCEILEYRKKKIPNGERSFCPSIMAGFTHYGIKQEGASAEYKNCWNVSGGFDFYVPRLSKGLFGEIYVTFIQLQQTYGKKKWINDVQNIVETDNTMRDISLKFGAGYQWKNWRVQPRIHGGYSVTGIWVREKNEYENTGFEQASNLYHGLYAATGFAYPLSKGALLFNYEYNMSFLSKSFIYEGSDDVKAKVHRFSFSIGYQFGH